MKKYNDKNVIRPAILDTEGRALPEIVQPRQSMSPLAKGILAMLLFIVGSSIVMLIFMFYGKFLGVESYEPDYHELRDNLLMPDGRDYWDNNNQTDMLVASNILEEDMNRQILERDNIDMTVDEFINSVDLPSGPMAGPSYSGGISA